MILDVSNKNSVENEWKRPQTRPCFSDNVWKLQMGNAATACALSNLLFIYIKKFLEFSLLKNNINYILRSHLIV